MKMLKALKDYDEAVEALIAYDQERDPERAALLRIMFDTQRIFFRLLGEQVSENSQVIATLADRVQGHISRQLDNIEKQQSTVLKRLGTQDVMIKTTYDNVGDIARILRGREQSAGYRPPPPGHDDPSEDHP